MEIFVTIVNLSNDQELTFTQINQSLGKIAVYENIYPEIILKMNTQSHMHAKKH